MYLTSIVCAGVAQWIERLPPEQEVVGSSPAVGVTCRSTFWNIYSTDY